MNRSRLKTKISFALPSVLLVIALFVIVFVYPGISYPGQTQKQDQIALEAATLVETQSISETAVPTSQPELQWLVESKQNPETGFWETIVTLGNKRWTLDYFKSTETIVSPANNGVMLKGIKMYDEETREKMGFPAEMPHATVLYASGTHYFVTDLYKTHWINDCAVYEELFTGREAMYSVVFQCDTFSASNMFTSWKRPYVAGKRFLVFDVVVTETNPPTYIVYSDLVDIEFTFDQSTDTWIETPTYHPETTGFN